MPANISADALFTEFNVREDTDKPHFLRLHDNLVNALEGFLRGRPDSGGWLLGQVEDGTERVLHLTGFLPAAAAPEPGATVGVFRLHDGPDWRPDARGLKSLERIAQAGPLVFLSLRLAGTDLAGVLYLVVDGVWAEGRRTVEFPFSLAQLAGPPPPVPQPWPPAAVPPRTGKRQGLWGWVSAAAGVAALLCLAALWNLGILEQGAPAPDTVSAEPALPAYVAADPLPDPEPAPEPEPEVIGLPAPPPKPAARSAKPQARPFTPPPAPAAGPALSVPAVPAAPAVSGAGDLGSAPLPGTSLLPAPAPGPVLVPPKPIRQTATSLSPDARRRIQGEVVIRVRVSVDAAGNVMQASAEPGGPDFLRDAAVAAARQWQFEPARENGRPVPGQADLLFRFAGRR